MPVGALHVAGHLLLETLLSSLLIVGLYASCLWHWKSGVGCTQNPQSVAVQLRS